MPFQTGKSSLSRVGESLRDASQVPLPDDSTTSPVPAAFASTLKTDFQVALFDQLSSSSDQYLVQAFVGEGSFGKVAKCLKLGTKETVAIKILNKEHDVLSRARQEVNMLERLRSLDPDKCHIVRWHSLLLHKGHPCLVFEMLDMSLFHYIRQRRTYMSLKEIRPIIQQLAMACKALESVGVIHGDLKPGNIMVVDHTQQPIRVKVNNFGLSIPISAAERCSRLQTLRWRAPEILLGLSFNAAIDMWSLGCIMADCFLRHSLFHATNEYNMIRLITHTVGWPEEHLLNAGAKTSLFFRRNPLVHVWMLKKPAIKPSTKSQWPTFSSLDELKTVGGLF